MGCDSWPDNADTAQTNSYYFPEKIREIDIFSAGYAFVQGDIISFFTIVKFPLILSSVKPKFLVLKSLFRKFSK